jgi:thiol-disulfide isomerase/thioredoxin
VTSRSRRTAAALAALVASAVLGACSNEVGSSGDAGFVSGEGIITRLPVDERATPGEVSGETIDGKPISLDDVAGRTVVVNVWGSWCAPCRSEAPDLVAASKELADDDVAFLGINSRDLDQVAARAFVRRFRCPTSIYDQRAAPAGLPRHASAELHPEHRGHRRPGPGGGQRPR